MLDRFIVLTRIVIYWQYEESTKFPAQTCNFRSQGLDFDGTLCSIGLNIERLLLRRA